jgi:hypothetical protein
MNMVSVCPKCLKSTLKGPGTFGNNFHEADVDPSFYARSLNLLQIRMLLGLNPTCGGDRTAHRIIAIDNTGSNILTLFTTDLQQLGKRALTCLGQDEDRHRNYSCVDEQGGVARGRGRIGPVRVDVQVGSVSLEHKAGRLGGMIF